MPSSMSYAACLATRTAICATWRRGNGNDSAPTASRWATTACTATTSSCRARSRAQRQTTTHGGRHSRTPSASSHLSSSSSRTRCSRRVSAHWHAKSSCTPNCWSASPPTCSHCLGRRRPWPRWMSCSAWPNGPTRCTSPHRSWTTSRESISARGVTRWSSRPPRSPLSPMTSTWTTSSDSR